jgi:S-formylglutathione hydrolase FrmB
MFVILPDVGTPPYPVFYLLHGLSDDYTNWLRRTRIEWYVRELPLIVVIPDGFRGWYTNNACGVDYSKYIAVETVDYVDTFFPTKKSRDGRAIGGLSMGGYGALRLALGYPDRFISATSHSGALIPWNREPATLDPRESANIFGETPSGSDHDLLTLARRAKDSGAVPHIRMDCGLADTPWIGNNRFIHQELEKLGVANEYAEFAGGHDWDYWDLHVQEAIAFHCRHLGIKPVPPVA